MQTTMTWEEVVAWCMSNPDMAALVEEAYFGDPLNAAQRYYKSAEYAEIRAIIPEKPGRALDMGAGSGILSWALAQDGWSVTAVEPDESHLVGAGAIRQMAREAGATITVIESRGENIPLEAGGFDLVVARQVLHHAADLSDICCEMARLSHPNATIMTLRDHVISGEWQKKAFFDRHPLHRFYSGENAFTLKQYRSAIEEAGLIITAELRSFQSVLNYDPLTEDGIRVRLAQQFGPLEAPAQKVLNILPFSVICSVATMLDRRPGRLVSYIAKNGKNS